MRPAPFIGVALALALLAGLLVFQLGTLSPTYAVQGRVVGFGNDGRTLLVAHEDIPGFMPAMTMPFSVDDPAEAALLEVGQAVGFTLHVAPNQTWITDLSVLPDAAVPPLAQSPLAAAAPDSVGLLAVGDAVPNVTLVDQDGTPFQLADLQGRRVVLTFIYTRCPLPDYCPRLSLQFQALRDQLGPAQEDVQLLSVSFDPAYDTPAVLRTYAAQYTPDTARWTFATGTLEQIATLAAAFGVFYEADGATFDHNLTTALIDAEGRVAHLWRGNTWRAADVMGQLDAPATAP